MRARLTKTQIQMLLDGKAVSSPRHKFALPPGESEVRTMLQNCIDHPEVLDVIAVFLDMDELQIVVEDKK